MKTHHNDCYQANAAAMRRTFELFLLALLIANCNGWSVASSNRRAFLDTLVASSFALVVPAQATTEPLTTIRKPATIETLIPILQIQLTAKRLLHLIQDDPSNPSIRTLTQSIPSEEKLFKRIFDEYSDPISYKQKFVDQNAFLVYYSKGFDGPGRPSIESDLPVKQTLQYGARNDAWVAYNDFLVEFKYQQQNTAEENNADDLVLPLQTMIESLDQYLSQASSQQIASALRTIQNVSQ